MPTVAEDCTNICTCSLCVEPDPVLAMSTRWNPLGRDLTRCLAPLIAALCDTCTSTSKTSRWVTPAMAGSKCPKQESVRLRRRSGPVAGISLAPCHMKDDRLLPSIPFLPLANTQNYSTTYTKCPNPRSLSLVRLVAFKLSFTDPSPSQRRCHLVEGGAKVQAWRRCRGPCEYYRHQIAQS